MKKVLSKIGIIIGLSALIGSSIGLHFHFQALKEKEDAVAAKALKAAQAAQAAAKAQAAQAAAEAQAAQAAAEAQAAQAAAEAQAAQAAAEAQAEDQEPPTLVVSTEKAATEEGVEKLKLALNTFFTNIKIKYPSNILTPAIEEEIAVEFNKIDSSFKTTIDNLTAEEINDLLTILSKFKDKGIKEVPINSKIKLPELGLDGPDGPPQVKIHKVPSSFGGAG